MRSDNSPATDHSWRIMMYVRVVAATGVGGLLWGAAAEMTITGSPVPTIGPVLGGFFMTALAGLITVPVVLLPRRVATNPWLCPFYSAVAGAACLVTTVTTVCAGDCADEGTLSLLTGRAAALPLSAALLLALAAHWGLRSHLRRDA
ncbi:hypothetical protein ACIQBJ_21100 [Kitasatospora sp. NPDC088391]|uniref:hypothetical protein n=1 Tax=Kitasatospora sp. NPDC088391 TaxID=3364074 RepID=UPI00380ADCA1